MTKFLEALEVQLDPSRGVKAKLPEFMAEPMTLTADYVHADDLERYTVSLNLNVPIS